MAFDAARGNTVLFGGSTTSPGQPNHTPAPADTWGWDGTTWQNLAPEASSSPNRRYGHAMAYDPGRQAIVLFGGTDCRGTVFGDTWEWNGSAWTNITVSGSMPGPRDSHAMAFDPVRGEVVMFGGSASRYLDEMWSWNGSRWTLLPKSRTWPSPRAGHRMVTDPVLGRVVLFGGSSASGQMFNYLWEWDGTVWTQRGSGQPAPPARVAHGMAWTPCGILVHGGSPQGSGEIAALADTWLWDGVNWMQLFPTATPGARQQHGMVFDSRRGQVVLFGGLDYGPATPSTFAIFGDTWEWNSAIVANYTSIGPGCPGSATGIPVLTARTLPVLGTSVVFDLTNSPPFARGALLVGTTQVQLDLGVIGAPGCVIYTFPLVSMPLFTDETGAWSSPSLSIGNDPGSLAFSFLLQGVLVDRRASTLGLIVSNAGRATVGFAGVWCSCEASTLALFRFDEGTGTVTSESCNNLPQGQLGTGVVWAPGKFGTSAVSFDGSNEVTFPDPNDRTTAGITQITVEAWVYLDPQDLTKPVFREIVRRDNRTLEEDYNLRFTGGTAGSPPLALDFRYNLTTAPGTPLAKGPVTVAGPPAWYHVVGQYDGVFMKVFFAKEGQPLQLVDAQAWPGVPAPQPSGAPIQVGRGVGQGLTGCVDEVRISNVARY